MNDFKDPNEDPVEIQADRDRCLALIRTLAIQLETAVNLQYLADHDAMTSRQASAFQAQLCEELEIMGRTLSGFFASRATTPEQ